ncbi:MAG: hypothetical protein HXS52_00410 [Theionarchaea archaeon]|nr:hypothetical protein [Theionarchaea archaeon]MBU7036363.1 hypothetical protein [Theionarchaea archaeon]
MEYAVEGMIGYVSYFTLGVLFFFVIWSFTEKITCHMVRDGHIGGLLGLIAATYGFWYPFVPFLRIPYVVLLGVGSLAGSTLSRFGMVNTWSTRYSRFTLAGIVIGLAGFDILQLVLSVLLVSSPYREIGTLISWVLLVYGISPCKIIGAVIENSGLPRSKFIWVAFILACVVFLPLEFPLIYGLMSLSAVLGTLAGLVFACRAG